MQLKHIVCLRKPTANMHYRKLPVKIGLNASEVTILTLRTRSAPEDQKQLRTPICKRYWMKMIQTQDQLAKVLNMTRQGVSKRLHAMGKIQKEGKWVPHELTERQMENRRTTSEILLLRHERKSFLHRIVTAEKWIYFENSKRKKSWLSPGETSTST